MTKALEALNKLGDDIVEHCCSGGIHDIDMSNIPIIQKDLKALEIIKKYPFVVFHIIKGTTYYEIQHRMPTTELPTEEEYNLLKEVLL